MKLFERPSPELRRLTRAQQRAGRSLRLVPLVIGAVLGLGFAYVAAGLTGIALATAAGLALLVWSIDVPAAVGIALVGSGAVAALIEGDLVRSVEYANDRPVAAALLRSGMIIVTAGALLEMATTRTPSPLRTNRATLSLSGERLRAGAETVAIALVAAASWWVFGPEALHGDLAIAADRLDDGMGLKRALAGLDTDTRAAFGTVTSVAFGPATATQLGCLFLGAGAAGSWAAARNAHSQCRATVAAWAPIATVIAVLWPGGSLADAVVGGLVGSSLAGVITRQPAGALLAGSALGLATLSQPEAVFVVPLVFAIVYADGSEWTFLPGAGLLAYLGITWPWWSWSSSHLDLGPLNAVDVATVARLSVPVVALAAVLRISQWRRSQMHDDFIVPF